MTKEELFEVIKSLTGSKNLIVVPKVFIEITEDMRAAVLLAQLVFWSDLTKNKYGMVYKTNEEFATELGMNDYGIRKAKEILQQKDLIEVELHKANGVPTSHYKINYTNLVDAVGRLTGSSHVQPTGSSHVQPTNNSNYKQLISNTSLSPNGDKASDKPKPRLMSPDMEKAYKEGIELNKYWKKVVGKRGHNSLESKFLPSGKFGGSNRQAVEVYFPITSAIRCVGLEQLKQAVDNYAETQKLDDPYMLGSTWSLAEFCHNMNYKEYLGGIRKTKPKFNDPWDEIKNEFEPLTSSYTKIFDEKSKRYYGFKLDKINSEIRQEDTETQINYDINAWNFDQFMELEWMIAGMIWRRSKVNELAKCQKYMIKWKELIPKFKKEAKTWLKEDWELYG